jgi:demethylmenaquinone methyltransferase/2-methoxy-6-polyprenyl-1,4-benzoquinol methylase
MARQRITLLAISGRLAYSRPGMSRSSTSADRPDGPESAQAPHPVLSRYYQRADERPSFLVDLFDGAAGYYDRLCGVMSLGSGRWYRGWVLRRAGLRPGMKVLDVATGTGLVARAAADIVLDPRAVVGLDPSGGMLRQARRTFAGPLVQGRIEELPYRDRLFDFVTIGYALRHAADLAVAFRECLRVLAPGGRLVVLEISRPRSRAMQAAIRVYLTRAMPLVMRTAHARLLMQYYWETIDTCVPAETILDVLRDAGFTDVRRKVFGGVQSEYLGRRP